jgi:hypothetical protein
VQAEGILDPLHVILGLAKMALQRLLELRIVRLLDHLGQRFGDLLLRVINVAQRVHEQIVHALDVLAEQAHGGVLSFRRRFGVPGTAAPGFAD